MKKNTLDLDCYCRSLIYAVVYYFVFYFMITKLNLKTPGREPDDVEPKAFIEEVT